jgi:hypothetical protein
MEKRKSQRHPSLENEVTISADHDIIGFALT